MVRKGIIIVESEKEEVSYQTKTTMEYTPCMVVEGESGYNVIDWHWGEDREIAEKLAEDYNKKLGITQEEVEDLKFHSMFPEAS
jgi:hypothetical protein